MKWRELSLECQRYLVGTYIIAIPFTVLCFRASANYTLQWFLLTVTSLFVATINVRLPKISSMISMGDVFTILALVHFGPGPSLVTYWSTIVAAQLTDGIRRYRSNFLSKLVLHRFAFNLSICALSVWAMATTYEAISSRALYPLNVVLGLSGIALAWFFVNTTTLSLAISFWNIQSFWTVWREGVVLYLLNFSGSAAAAGLMSIFYREAGFLVFLLSLPVAVVMYQLYVFHIDRYEQAQKHISELNKLYLQTIETLASAVDAKDRYTHGHIRRVQAYAIELAKQIGVTNGEQLLAIQAGALLHDIGKLAIPEYILNKPTVLTETEYEKMKIHPVVGANMLGTIDFPYPVIPLVKSHHERWDGNGYPDGLKGEDIPLGARILSIVDCYDALTTNRPYRSPMPRQQIVELFRRESGRAYDPNIVEAFIANLERIEGAGRAVSVADTDVWGIKEVSQVKGGNFRNLERVQPTLSYGRALSAGPDVQRELYSTFEFGRADIQCLTHKDVFVFMGSKLSSLVSFDAAVFYTANLSEGVVTAAHVLGCATEGLLGLSLELEQKLSGWVAANNQSLCNLPPFPDFLKCEEPRPAFQISAIVPMNRNGRVLGTISLYRREPAKFSEEDFRRLEIVSSQTAIALCKCAEPADEVPLLFDSLTGVPNGFQLYLIFDQIATDAQKYEYPLAVFLVHLDEIKHIRKRWGHMSGDESIRATANYLRKELRETDLLVRYAADEFVALSPRMSHLQAETLRSRLQNELDHFSFSVRPDANISLPVSIGIGNFPEDGISLEALLSVAEWRMREDRELRAAVRHRIRQLKSPTS